MTTSPPHDSPAQSSGLSVQDLVNRRSGSLRPLPAAEELYFLALDQLAAGDPARAATLLRESIAIDPQFLDPLHALVRALQDQGRPDEAIDAALELMARDPDDVLAHTRLSILYQMKGMVSEAEAEATKAKLLGWKQQLRELRPASTPANAHPDPSAIG
jgi:tetratricopeptide (TPR) repeat protein